MTKKYLKCLLINRPISIKFFSLFKVLWVKEVNLTNDDIAFIDKRIFTFERFDTIYLHNITSKDCIDALINTINSLDNLDTILRDMNIKSSDMLLSIKSGYCNLESLGWKVDGRKVNIDELGIFYAILNKYKPHTISWKFRENILNISIGSV
jgi:hypothetical protein